MNRFAIVAGVIAAAGALSAQATDLAAIIQKVSENCDKIASYYAEARVRYKIWPNWYNRIGRYEYIKPDSMLLMLDSITGADTAWTAYNREAATSCNFSLVPSILSDPIMSSATVASWADNGRIIRDTLDTCVVEILKNSSLYDYSIDMFRGVILGLAMADTVHSATHQYFYGCDKGIYYLQRVSFSWSDTTIESGGYDFYNIRLNGAPVSAVINSSTAKTPRRAIYPAGNTTFIITGMNTTRVSLYDALGRTQFAVNYPRGTHTFRLDQACGRGGRPGGYFVVRVEEKGEKVYSTMIAR